MATFRRVPAFGFDAGKRGEHLRGFAAALLLTLGLVLPAIPSPVNLALAHTHTQVEPHSQPFAHIHTSPEHQLAPSDFDNAPHDLVLWGELAKASVTRKGGQYHATFLPSVLALDGKTITLIGFMAQVHPGERNTQFLLSDIRFLCDTCQTAPPPQSIVEINALEAHPQYEQAIRVRGKLELVRDGRYGLIYRLLNAQIIPR